MEDEEGVDSFADVQSKKGVRSLGLADHQQTSNPKQTVNSSVFDNYLID